MCTYNLFSVLLTFITISYYPKTQAFRVINENGVETILAVENETVDIECRTDMPMAYCGFLHPSGKRYSFSGLDSNVGKCNIKIKATTADSGEWRCHIGTQFVGVESMQIIQLRIVGKIAAVRTNITAVHGKPTTLYCTTTKGFIPLSYCRFEPPNGFPFSIDSSVTDENPLLKRYFFPANKSLDRGDCAVTIRKVKYEDVGVWTCGAGFDDGKEYIDTVNFDVEGLYTMSTASATGITFGTIGIFSLLTILGFIAWKKRSILGSGRTEAAREAHELQQAPRRPASSLQETPQQRRGLPLVTVESPSERSEPSTTSPLVPIEQA